MGTPARDEPSPYDRVRNARTTGAIGPHPGLVCDPRHRSRFIQSWPAPCGVALQLAQQIGTIDTQNQEAGACATDRPTYLISDHAPVTIGHLNPGHQLGVTFL